MSKAPRWLPYAVALAVGAILLLLLMRACGGADDTAGTTADTGDGASSSADRRDPGRRGRRPTTSAVRWPRSQAELVGLGLRVTVVRSEGGGVVGTVKDVTPTGTVEEGTAVQLQVVADPKPKPEPPPGPDKDEAGQEAQAAEARPLTMTRTRKGRSA